MERTNNENVIRGILSNTKSKTIDLQEVIDTWHGYMAIEVNARFAAVSIEVYRVSIAKTK